MTRLRAEERVIENRPKDEGYSDDCKHIYRMQSSTKTITTHTHSQIILFVKRLLERVERKTNPK